MILLFCIYILSQTMKKYFETPNTGLQDPSQYFILAFGNQAEKLFFQSTFQSPWVTIISREYCTAILAILQNSWCFSQPRIASAPWMKSWTCAHFLTHYQRSKSEGASIRDMSVRFNRNRSHCNIRAPKSSQALRFVYLVLTGY